MELYFENRQTLFPVSKERVLALLLFALKKLDVSCDELSVHFIEEAEIMKLHADYFDDPSPTDCISFPIDPPGTVGYTVLGEIFVSPQAALEHAKEGDLSSEVSLYLLHGLLHLLGYNDEKEEDATLMEREQEALLEEARREKCLL